MCQSGIEPATLEYQEDALTSGATQPGKMTLFLTSTTYQLIFQKSLNPTNFWHFFQTLIPRNESSHTQKEKQNKNPKPQEQIIEIPPLYYITKLDNF